MREAGGESVEPISVHQLDGLWKKTGQGRSREGRVGVRVRARRLRRWNGTLVYPLELSGLSATSGDNAPKRWCPASGKSKVKEQTDTNVLHRLPACCSVPLLTTTTLDARAVPSLKPVGSAIFTVFVQCRRARARICRRRLVAT